MQELCKKAANMLQTNGKYSSTETCKRPTCTSNVHGDLKASNVHVESSGGSQMAMLLDFGLSRLPRGCLGADGRRAGGRAPHLVFMYWLGLGSEHMCVPTEFIKFCLKSPIL